MKKIFSGKISPPNHSTRSNQCKNRTAAAANKMFTLPLFQVLALLFIFHFPPKVSPNLVFQKSSNIIVSYNYFHTDSGKFTHENTKLQILNAPTLKENHLKTVFPQTPFNISSPNTQTNPSRQTSHSTFQYETQVQRIRHGNRLKANIEFYGQNAKKSLIFLTTADEIRILTSKSDKQFFKWSGDISAKNTCQMIHGKNVSDIKCHNFVQIFALGAPKPETNFETGKTPGKSDISTLFLHMCGTNYQLPVCAIFEATVSEANGDFELISSRLLARTKETPTNYDNVEQKLEKMKRENENVDLNSNSFSIAVDSTMIVAKNQRLLKLQYYPSTNPKISSNIYKITVGKLHETQLSDSIFDSKILDLFLSQSKTRAYMVSNEHGFAKIAHVCVNDRGGIGNSEFRKTWASFMKTRLVCPGTVTELSKVEITNGKIYGLFGNKLCEFDVNSIESQFKSAKYSKIGNSGGSKGSISSYLVKILQNCDFDELYSRMSSSKRKRLTNEFKKSVENSELLEPVVGSVVYEFNNENFGNIIDNSQNKQPTNSINFGEILRISSVERSPIYDELFIMTTSDVFKLVMPRTKELQTLNATISSSYLVERFQNKTCNGNRMTSVVSTGDQIFGFNKNCILELPHSVFACKIFSSSESCCNLSRNPACYWTGKTPSEGKCTGNAIINQNLNFTHVKFNEFEQVCPDVSLLLEQFNPKVYPLFPKTRTDDSFVGMVASFWGSDLGKITTACIAAVFVMILVIIYCGIRLKTTQKAGEELYDQAQEALKFIPMNEETIGTLTARNQDSLKKIGRNNSTASDFNYSKNYIERYVEQKAAGPNEGFSCTPPPFNVFAVNGLYENIQNNPQIELPATPSDQQILAFQNLQRTLEKTEKKFSSLPRSKSLNMRKQQSVGQNGKEIYAESKNGPSVWTPQYEGRDLMKPVGHRGTIGKYRE